MAKCKKCGKTLDEGVKFCPSCGTAVSEKSVKTETQNQEIQQADPNDAEQNKGMAVVAYILFFIPLITGDHKKSPFVMYHTNQGAVLFITCVALSVASSILTTILYRLPLGLISIFGLITPLVGIVMFVLFIIGILNALKGIMKPLPVIGKFVIIK
jgi:uncharacterized membrane protein